MNSTQFEPLLSAEQAATLLGGMHPKTLMRLARASEVPAVKIGRYWFFRATSLNEWIEAKCAHRPCLPERIQ
jgi:excisionase family DNA binding protein